MRKHSSFFASLATFVGVAVALADAPAAPPNLSPADMVAKAAQTQSKIKDDYQFVLRVKNQARKSNDVIKLSCVNDKLVQLKAEMNIADGLNDQLQGALEKKSGEEGGVFGRLTESGDRIHGLREEAAKCIGVPELYKQEASSTFAHPLFPDDPNNPPEAFGEPPEAPGYASPYR